MARVKLKNPKGTRDLYPDELLRQRYITDAWRRVSTRHGCDEVDGPTFETTELYTVKSGDGIVGELFQAFSGKDPTKVDRSAAYITRYLAKNVVAAGLASRCTIQIAYAIGVSEPLSLYVDTHGTCTEGVTDAGIEGEASSD